MATPQRQHDAHLKATLLYKLGKAYAALEHHTEATGSLSESYQILQGEGAGTPLEIVTILENLETSYKKLAGQEEKAAEVHMTIESILTEVAESTNISNLEDLADYYIAQGRLSDAETVLAHTQTLLQQPQQGEPTVRQIRGVGVSYLELGRAYEKQEVHDEALVAYQRAAQLVSAKVDSHLHGVIMQDIGDIYRAQKQFDQALTYYEKAREYKDHDLVGTLGAIGDLHIELRQPENAVAVYKQAIEKLDTEST